MFKNRFGDDLVPRRQTVGSAGYDFYLPTDVTFHRWKTTSIDTGVYIEKGTKVDFGDGPTDRWVFVLCPRSGLGTRHGTRFRNTVGIIDSDYTGPEHTIKADMTSDDPWEHPLKLDKGDRFAQGIFLPYGTVVGETVPDAVRNGGHGSTGVGQ